MKCEFPMSLGRGGAFACGHCFSCRLNRRRELQHRIMLEASCHKENAFVTLTYEDAKLPLNATGVGTLRPSDLQNFLKRLRSRLAPLRIRFFGVGEYGEVTMRPHFHVAIFGFPHCQRLLMERRIPCCSVCTMIGNAWGIGHVQVGSLTPDSSQYIAGYTVKKMTSFDHPKLDGRFPEFARWSGGLGKGAMWDVASTLLALDFCEPDVPSGLRYNGNKILPFGRYLRRELRAMMGRSRNAPQETIDAMAAEVQPLWETWWDATSIKWRSESFTKTLSLLREGDAASVASRFGVSRKRRSL